jgi:hypothetical protein
MANSLMPTDVIPDDGLDEAGTFYVEIGLKICISDSRLP